MKKVMLCTYSCVYFLIFLSLVVQLQAAILTRGIPLSFHDSKPYFNQIRKKGIRQFMSHYHKVKNLLTPRILWGDEIEFGIFQFLNHHDMAHGKSYDLALLRGTEILTKLEEKEKSLQHLPIGCKWQPEYGSWMLESIPRDPYNTSISSLLSVETSMKLRRHRIHELLYHNEISPTITTFPLMGLPGLPHSTFIRSNNSISESRLISDHVISQHPRFLTLTKNIRLRRGSNVNIAIPKDKLHSCSCNQQQQNCIQMDAMAFGMGCCCLQITQQFSSELESRFMHDQLAILSPLFMSLSAASPIFKGTLAAVDTRWNVISQAVDDRTAAERGETSALHDKHLAGNGRKRIRKSRFSSISQYIGKNIHSKTSATMKRLNDLDVEIDSNYYNTLVQSGIDHELAMHISHLFIRDPLVLFQDGLLPTNASAFSTDQFDHIQSTNWRTVRWKLPDIKSINLSNRRNIGNVNQSSTDLGWRVEFRPMEIQLTDFENAAYSLCVVLLSRLILSRGYNFYLPLSYVEENIRCAQLKDSVINQKFYFNKNTFRTSKTTTTDNKNNFIPNMSDIEIVEVTLDEIFNGSPVGSCHNILGIIPAINSYLDENDHNSNSSNKKQIQEYLSILSKRASCTLPTTAKWIRTFVENHSQYKHDGVVSKNICNDFLTLCDDIGMGKMPSIHLFGENSRTTSQSICCTI